MEPSDEAIVERVQRGETEAFAELVQRYRHRLYSLAYHLTGHPEEAADAAQEVFVRAFEALPRFRPEARFAPWLFRIAANLCVSWQRRLRHRPASLEAALGEGQEPVAPAFGDSSPTPEEAYLQRAFQEEVRRAVRSLPAKLRQVIVLRYLEDMTYRDIAAALGLRVTTVETRLRAARRLLREKLQRLLETNDVHLPIHS